MLARFTFIIGLVLTTMGCQPDGTTESRAVGGLRLDTLLGDSASNEFKRAEATRTFVFPADHGAHPGYRSEWWYLTTILEDTEGELYGVHFTLFRQALSANPTGDGPWHTGQAYLGHLAVTDVNNATHLTAERFARGHPDLAGVTTGANFSAVIEDWSLQGSANETLKLTLRAGNAGSFNVDLNITQTEPIVLQGNRGLSEKGPGSASYYYSIPRLEIDGTLDLGDHTVQVSGLGWLDREWSTSVLSEGVIGWDWFSLQLDDARSIMAFRLRREDGHRDAFDHGLLLDHQLLPPEPIVGAGNNGVTLLTPDKFTLTPVRYSADTNGIDWPVSWTLTLTDQSDEEQLTVNALVDDQVVDLSVVYWEGLVEVLDSNGNRLGLGYMELTGYGSAL